MAGMLRWERQAMLVFGKYAIFGAAVGVAALYIFWSFFDKMNCKHRGNLPALCSCGLSFDPCLDELNLTTDVSVRNAGKLIWADLIQRGHLVFGAVEIFRSTTDTYTCYGMIANQHIIDVQCLSCDAEDHRPSNGVQRPPLACIYNKIYGANTLLELENILGVLGQVNIDCARGVCQVVVKRSLDLEDYYLGEHNADIHIIAVLDARSRISSISSISHAK